jgi:ATP-dependent Clp protease adaptor protein ClpS
MIDLNNSLSGASNSGANPMKEAETSGSVLFEEPWHVILFDDPVNTMNYVATALREVLKVDGPTAERMMLEAHTTGRSSVFEGDRQEAEKICVSLHTWTLNAKVAR